MCPSPILRVVTDFDVVHKTLGCHCIPCLHSRGMESLQVRRMQPRLQPRTPASAISDASYYSACTSITPTAVSPASSPDDIKTEDSPLRMLRSPPLRRKQSPTEVSLRELCATQKQEASLRAKQSEEQLRRVYESQIRSYLESPFGYLGSIIE